jgi:hypothetical protein
MEFGFRITFVDVKLTYRHVLSLSSTGSADPKTDTLQHMLAISYFPDDLNSFSSSF